MYICISLSMTRIDTDTTKNPREYVTQCNMSRRMRQKCVPEKILK